MDMDGASTVIEYEPAAVFFRADRAAGDQTIDLRFGDLQKRSRIRKAVTIFISPNIRMKPVQYCRPRGTAHACLLVKARVCR